MRATKKAISLHKKDCKIYQDALKKKRQETGLKNLAGANKVQALLRKNDPAKWQQQRVDASRKAASSLTVRQTRRETLSSLNKTEKFKQKASATAKKTSIRPEIQQQRALILKKWREENPEKLLENIYKASSAAKRSKAEAAIEPALATLGFQRNVRLSMQGFRKQIDFVNSTANWLIEIDGPFHFHPIHGQDYLHTVQTRDRMLETLAPKNGWNLLRLSIDLFNNRTGYPKFDLTILEKLMVAYQKPVVLFCGRLYESLSKEYLKDMIWKSDIQDIITS